jgi:CBS domain-containing protein
MGQALCARDVMTKDVICVKPDERLDKIARLLLDRGISAVPVVNDDGVPVGIVSEGDLIGRGETDRLARRDWWLALVSGRQTLDDKFREQLAVERNAADVMSAPLVTVTEETDVSEIARLLAIHHIKRVPVVNDGRLVGIVSRADLLRAVAAGLADTAPDKQKHQGLLTNLFGEYHLPANQTVAGNTPPASAPEPRDTRLSATNFRHLVEDFHHQQTEHLDDARRAAARLRRERAKQLIDQHVFDDGWRQLLHHAREAAEKGETESMLLSFPSQLCIDRGRAINVAEKHWPTTLRGTPAEIFLRWERDLKSQGFGLTGRILDFPSGKPGDAGLFLVWGEAG